MSFDDKLFEYTLKAARDFENGFETNPVVPMQDAIDAIEAFDEPVPMGKTDALDVIKLLNEIGTPATTLSRSGRFFGFVVGGTLPVSVASSWLTSTWDQNAALTVLGYTAAKLEQVSRKWIVEMLDLPAETAMGFVSGATMAGFTALSSARHRIYKNLCYDLKKQGLRNAPEIKIVVSADIHATNISALNYMGYGRDELTFVPVDDQGRIILSEMPKLDDRTIVLVQAGNINSGAFDDFHGICDMAEKAGAWVHVDGAFGGWMKLSPKRRHLCDGMERADSWSIDCHKWLNVPYDSAIAIVKDREAMMETFTISASYLTTDGERIPNNFTPELSRRARGVDVWAALKHLGRDGFGEMIDRCSDHAAWFAPELEKLGFTIMNDVVINQIVFCLNDNDDERLDRIFKRVNDSGKAWFGSTKWQDRTVYRMSIISHETTKDDLMVALDAIKDALDKV
ncbi:pyridoxal phosphate-dependent decarboxylase family protein [Pseudemcibacter aquimaris]|uniref:pyridoxal phosphate-dependent decarboxylase family protein n=1 Tax=Pseudemcibacter aquimaris TaxID=2857064 RepID=UPI002011E4A5|nr:aminotransferase class V-fold PLP-dependent enzyme [Pseudemcibacter aquimaris]MCC3859834.1 aminotransferase class V-fold PLP-dependent enzyme [Pseudemcibacter aquimaris]WDU57166.1 aminotransferase class V-fold PLP-dependent enzyme [Pseudemcibacter aquimaris]